MSQNRPFIGIAIGLFVFALASAITMTMIFIQTGNTETAAKFAGAVVSLSAAGSLSAAIQTAGGGDSDG